MDIRNFFFKIMSLTPIPIEFSIIYFAQPDNHNVFLGFAVLLVGELIRMWSVSYAGGETRTTKVGAPSLCTAGPYGYVRNPIYVGNMLMYLCIVIIAGIVFNLSGNNLVSLIPCLDMNSSIICCLS